MRLHFEEMGQSAKTYSHMARQKPSHPWESSSRNKDESKGSYSQQSKGIIQNPEETGIQIPSITQIPLEQRLNCTTQHLNDWAQEDDLTHCCYMASRLNIHSTGFSQCD